MPDHQTPDSGADPTDEVGGPYARYVLGVLILVYIFNFIDRQILSILAEEIKADLGISDADIGFLYGTAFAVFYAVFGIPLGRLADVWTRKSLISIGLAFWSGMTALSGTASNFASLAVYRFGVGIGEASATPAALSMVADYFSPRVRATVMAIYSSGVYIGAGIGLVLGGVIVDSWNGAYPDISLAPFGLKAWQAAFFAVGLPGLLLAIWVWTLKEPVRGASEGLYTPPHPHPFREGARTLGSVLPPFTLFSMFNQGGMAAVYRNLLAAAVVAGIAYTANALTQTPLQWIALGIGCYAAVSWVQNLRMSDPATYGMMFGSKAFVLATVGFPSLSFVTYGIGFWSAPYIVRTHGVSLAEAGTLLGIGSALGGFIGVTLGGVLADKFKPTYVNARLYVGLAVTVLSTPFVLGFLLTDNTTVAYICSFAFSIFSPMWLGAATSTVVDLVMPRMRAVATAYYIMMATFIGLALGPYVMGQVSDYYVGQGLPDSTSLQFAMLWGVLMFAFSAVVLLVCTRFLGADEQTRLARAKALGEPDPVQAR